MIIKALETIKKFNMLPYGSKVTAAVSGGADSMALFRLLCILKDDLGLTLQAAHINHCLRGAESDSDEALVRETCLKAGIECLCLRADISGMHKNTGKGLEECGRIVRYDFLKKCAGDGLIATAHTLSDAAETLILNLCRGAALSGLCGIPPVRGNIIRPLIACTREDTENFCKEQRVRYAVDWSNYDLCYNRNRIRHAVIPELKKINPSLETSLQRLIEQNTLDDAFLNMLGKQALKKSAVVCGGGKIGQKYSRDALLAESRPVRSRAFIAAAEISGCGHLEAKHIKSLEEMIQKGSGGISLPGNIKARISGGFLIFDPVASEKTDKTIPKFEMPLKEGEFSTPLGRIVISKVTKENILDKNSCATINNLLLSNLVSCDKISAGAVVRNRRAHDKITLPKRSVTKSLKKLFNEQGIPPAKRDLITVIADEKGVLWVQGFGCDKRALPGDDTGCFFSVNITEEQEFAK